MKDHAEDMGISESREGGVLTIGLGRAPAHALSLGHIRALHDSFERAAADKEVRAVIIYGEGRIFCAGHDLKEITRRRADDDDGRAYLEELFGACAEMMMALDAMPQPTLAVVEGIATAAGLQLMASCDMAFAGEEARFCLPGVRNGGFCTTPAVAVGRKLGRNHLMELALSGEDFGTDWAMRAGLVNRVYPTAEVLKEANGFAEVLASRYPKAMQDGKRATKHQLTLPLKEAYAAATPEMIGHFMDPVRIAEEKRDWS